MWGPDKDWQCFRCYSTYPPSQMSLHRSTKKWYCSACIHPTVINTPYILTPEQVQSITLRCSRCDSVFITRFKSKLEGNKSAFICQRCEITQEMKPEMKEMLKDRRAHVQLVRFNTQCPVSENALQELFGLMLTCIGIAMFTEIFRL